MINAVALCLVLSSIVTAGVWSPTPETNQNPSSAIVKEGHRVVVVEYGERENDGSTKVSISPKEKHVSESDDQKPPSVLDTSTMKEAAEDVKEKIQEATASAIPPKQSPRKLVCDALGKCRHKITTAIGRAKDKVSETAHELEEQAADRACQVEEGIRDTTQKAKEAVSEKAHEVTEKAKEGAKEMAEKAKHGAQTAFETSKTMGEDAVKNVSRTVDRARGKAEKTAEEAGEMAERVKERMKETVGISASVVHLLGFTTSYGMCIWVTFISSYVLVGVLPRQQFGMVQSKIYPVYFRAMAYGVLVAFLGQLYLSHQHQKLFSKTPEMFQCCNLLASFSMLLFNLLYLEPRATKVMFQRMKVKKEEGRGKDESTPVRETGKRAAVGSSGGGARTSPGEKPERSEEEEEQKQKEERREAMSEDHKLVELSKKLKKLNAYSSWLNIMTLMGLTWHLVYLAQRLQASR
ncbi:hypothetical protein NMG60_11035790 [Bertholletia excelsa]